MTCLALGSQTRLQVKYAIGNGRAAVDGERVSIEQLSQACRDQHNWQVKDCFGPEALGHEHWLSSECSKRNMKSEGFVIEGRNLNYQLL